MAIKILIIIHIIIIISYILGFSYPSEFVGNSENFSEDSNSQDIIPAKKFKD